MNRKVKEAKNGSCNQSVWWHQNWYLFTYFGSAVYWIILTLILLTLATRIWQSIESMFRVCDIDVEVLKTERPGHATEFCMTTPLERFADGLFCVSGDGTGGI